MGSVGRLVGTAAFTLLFLALSSSSLPREPARPAFGFVLDGHTIDTARINALRRTTSINPAMVTFFMQWPKDPAQGVFPMDSVRAISQAGATPCVTWEPMYIENGREVAIEAKAILDGDYDAFIDRFALGARQFGKPLILRFAHEMNLERYHWGSPREGYGPKSPGLYRSMFRHVALRFRKAGAVNVFFAFCPNAESLPHPDRDGATWNRARDYYPGGDVVDVLGMDGYNWGTTQTREKNGWDSPFRSFPDIFGPIREELAGLALGKPLMVFETASADAGGDKAAWILEALETAGAWNLAAVNWFEADKEVDWRLLTGVPPGISRAMSQHLRLGPGGVSVVLHRLGGQ